MLIARSLYAQAMGDAFDELDEGVRRFHSLRGRFTLHGHCRTEGPTSAMARFFARMARVPVEATDAPFDFELEADEHREHWTRRFPGKVMRSTMRVENTLLVERLGMTTFRFRLHAVQGALEMELVAFNVMGVPWPRSLRPRIHARETSIGGQFRFDVAAALPLLGRITSYRGSLWLTGAEGTP